MMTAKRSPILKSAVRVQVSLPGEDYDALKALAKQEETSLSVQVRRAVDIYLKILRGTGAKWA